MTDKHKRTNSQNNYLHLILSYFGLQTGNTLEYVKQNYYKKLVNPETFLRIINDPYLGKVEVLRSSADLSTEEASLTIDRFRNWSAMEVGIALPEAANEEAMLQMELEVERNKRYL